ncbi:MAG: hypothetical protein AAGC55_29515, partial [Myxococcota bacterium]
MRTRELTTAILLSTAVGVGLTALGSAPRWATCLAAALALATAIPLISSRRGAIGVSPLMLFLGLAAGFTALQLIPLPMAVIDLLT